jgi:hypothetical protein
MQDLAEARVDELLPLQEQLGDLLGMPEGLPALQQLREARRKGGRPAGARNKRLDEIARQVRERFGDVLLRQVAVATMPLADLMALGLKPGEALAEQRLSAATVLPYLEQRKPLAVDVTGRQVVHLTIATGLGDGEQDQGVIDGFVVQLDGARLDDAPNPLASQVEPPAAQLITDQAPAPAPAPPPLAPPPARPRGPGGPVSTPRRLLHARAGVVSPDTGISERTENQALAAPGTGEGVA